MKRLTRERFSKNDLNRLYRMMDRLSPRMTDRLFRKEGIFTDDIEGIHKGKPEKVLDRLAGRFPDMFKDGISCAFATRPDRYRNRVIEFTLIKRIVNRTGNRNLRNRYIVTVIGDDDIMQWEKEIYSLYADRLAEATAQEAGRMIDSLYGMIEMKIIREHGTDSLYTGCELSLVDGHYRYLTDLFKDTDGNEQEESRQ